TPQMRVLVAVEPVDGRKGIDGLAQLCRQKLATDPFSGCVFVFRNRSGTTLKVLVYDGQGFWLAQKRLSHGRFRSWPGGGEPVAQGLAVPVAPGEAVQGGPVRRRAPPQEFVQPHA